MSDQPRPERVDFVICVSVSNFPDDVYASCARCAATIVHRPSMPAALPKICVSCALALIDAKES